MAGPTGPGDLTERVTFQEVTRSSDGGGGGGSRSWSNISTTPTVWAMVEPMRGRERFAAEQIESRRDYRVWVRYRGDITDTMRLVWRSKSLAVRFISDEGPLAEFLMLECESGAEADG